MVTASQRTLNIRIRNIEEKKYYCEECKKAYRDQEKYTKHLASMKHNPGRYKSYTCPNEACAYTTPLKSRINLHYTSQKHIRNS